MWTERHETGELRCEIWTVRSEHWEVNIFVQLEQWIENRERWTGKSEQ